MSQKEFTLAYIDDDDRAYGLAGMAISMAALDALDKIAEVSLDSPETMVTFSNDYYFSTSPSVSPKVSWGTLINNFHLTSAMVLSNVMARSVVRLGKEVPSGVLKEIYSAMEAEGGDTCSLEPDEVKTLYNRAYSHMRRIFENPRLRPAISSFADVISRRRNLSGTEVRDELELLQLI